MIARVLAKKGATVWVRWMIYKEVAQLVILYGSESWVVTGEMMKVLERFNHWLARQITGMTATCDGAGSGDIPWWWQHYKKRHHTPYWSTFGGGRQT